MYLRPPSVRDYVSSGIGNPYFSVSGIASHTLETEEGCGSESRRRFTRSLLLDSLSTKRKLQRKLKRNVTWISHPMTDGGVEISTPWIGFNNWVLFHLSLRCKLRLVLKLSIMNISVLTPKKYLPPNPDMFYPNSWIIRSLVCVNHTFCLSCVNLPTLFAIRSIGNIFTCSFFFSN